MRAAPRCHGRSLLVALVIVLQAGCSIYSLPGDQPDPPPAKPASQPPAPIPDAPKAPPRDPNASNAYGGLVAKAQEARARGDYEQALALLERAQRIDPDSGEIYLELARTYADKGDTTLARSTAERGMLYCRGTECEALRAYTR